MTAELSAGQRLLDKYTLLRSLGEGGMASVWVARDETLEIDVAIKFIRADLAHPGLTERLLNEARAAAKLEHPAIVRVREFGRTVAGDPFIVMELLNGEDLASRIRRERRIDPIEAVRILIPIAHALATAHGKGIVHRDLKPDNVFISERDGGRLQPKLVDFGIAKLDREGSKRLTQAGAIFGSPAYMSPEQARGKDVDARADVWSFCVMLYEIITGRLPFDAPTHAALVCAILESAPIPAHELGGGDPSLWAIIDRGLRKDPDQRWQSMRELGAELARWLLAREVVDDASGAALTSTWSEHSARSRAVSGTAYRVYSDADENAETAVATQLSFQNAGTGTKPPSGNLRKIALIAAAAFAVTLLVTVPVLYKALGSNPTSAEPASATPPVAASSESPAVTATTATATATEPPAPVVEPAPAASASAGEPDVADAPKPAAPSKPIVRAPSPKPTVKPATKPATKPTAKPIEKPAPKPANPDLDIKTTL